MEAECRALAGTDCRPLLLRRRASRPQDKHMALEMRAQCERCGAGLKPEGAAVMSSAASQGGPVKGLLPNRLGESYDLLRVRTTGAGSRIATPYTKASPSA